MKPFDDIGYVYIVADKYNNALYIGSTNNPDRRIREHLYEWGEKKYDIDRILVAYTGTYQLALACEAWLIHANRPRWNKLTPAKLMKDKDARDYLKLLTFEVRKGVVA